MLLYFFQLRECEGVYQAEHSPHDANIINFIYIMQKEMPLVVNGKVCVYNVFIPFPSPTAISMISRFIWKQLPV